MDFPYGSDVTLEKLKILFDEWNNFVKFSLEHVREIQKVIKCHISIIKHNLITWHSDCKKISSDKNKREKVMNEWITNTDL